MMTTTLTWHKLQDGFPTQPGFYLLIGRKISPDIVYVSPIMLKYNQVFGTQALKGYEYWARITHEWVEQLSNEMTQTYGKV